MLMKAPDDAVGKALDRQMNEEAGFDHSLRYNNYIDETVFGSHHSNQPQIHLDEEPSIADSSVNFGKIWMCLSDSRGLLVTISLDVCVANQPVTARISPDEGGELVTGDLSESGSSHNYSSQISQVHELVRLINNRPGLTTAFIAM
ncbi:hypothetical protein RRG08_014068 [Elysia crispata]|uniref:Uncharacterized protein n=1 Tax=Elysia crispata TaxID=231223 RepID=A0AAE1DPL0_9GAST|nr:hypothetical protein RRG08_014068 [Elysia crispata]